MQCRPRLPVGRVSLAEFARTTHLRRSCPTRRITDPLTAPVTAGCWPSDAVPGPVSVTGVARGVANSDVVSPLDRVPSPRRGAEACPGQISPPLKVHLLS